MDPLLDLAIRAHGGRERWEQAHEIVARARSGGFALASRWKPRTFRRYEVRLSTREPRAVMPKILKCGDLMPGCNFVAEGKDEAEVMAKGAEHAKTAHGMASIPPALLPKVKAAIRDK
jgi:predicted small metal-binding protein